MKALAGLRKLATVRNGVIVAVVCAGIVFGYVLGRRGGPARAPSEAVESTEEAAAVAETYWTCPMHPEIVRDGPGRCPICGMKLVERKRGAPVEGESEVEGLVPVKLSERDQQLIGVRTEKLRIRRLKKDIRAYGNVEPDETSLYSINTKVEGWIEKLYVDYTGQEVSAGQPLLTIYSPELVQTQQEYLLALRARKKLGSSRFQEVARSGEQLVASARERLRLWDISDEQIRRLERSGQIQKTMTLHAPTDGVVMERHATEGMKVTPGMPLFKLADLSHVWVQAALYDQDLPLVREGMSVDITFEGLQGKYSGTITFIEPVVEGRTRTSQARIVVENPDSRIKPNMYATVFIHVPLGGVLALPKEAVMHTGQRKIVFVAQEKGHFEPREVETGRETNDYYEVLSGVEADEEVVTSGNFMIDAESRTQAAIRGRMLEQAPGTADKSGGDASH